MSKHQTKSQQRASKTAHAASTQTALCAECIRWFHDGSFKGASWEGKACPKRCEDCEQREQEELEMSV